MRYLQTKEGYGDKYIGSLFRVDEPVPDDSRVVRPANSVENPWHGCQS